MTTTDTGPQTEAGRHYLDQPPGSLDEWRDAILAIEREAASPAALDVEWLESQIREWHASSEPASSFAERIAARLTEQEDRP